MYVVHSTRLTDALEELAKSMMRYAVLSYQSMATQSPLAAWEERYEETSLAAEEGEVRDAARRVCEESDNRLSRYLRTELEGEGGFLRGLLRSYAQHLREGPSLQQRDMSNCGASPDGYRKSPLTWLMTTQVGYSGLMFGGDVSHMNNTSSFGVIVYDYENCPHTREEVTPWPAEMRSSLLRGTWRHRTW